MPLINTPYQQLGFNPFRPTECCVGDDNYCSLFEPNDTVHGQFTQAPCEPSIVCDGDLDDFVPEEVILDPEFDNLEAQIATNPTFTTSATPWTLGTGWTFDTDHVEKVATLAPSNLSQLLPVQLVQDAVYQIIFTINASGGVGTVTPFLTDGITTVTGNPATANATFTRYIKCRIAGAQTLGLIASLDWAGEIDSFFIRRVAFDWDFGNDTGAGEGDWEIGTTGFASTANIVPATCTTTPLKMYGIITPFTTYDLEVVINSGTGGQIAFDIGGNLTFYTLVTGATTITIAGVVSGAGVDFATSHPLGFCGVIESISLLTQESTCWDFEATHWIAGDGFICHIPGTADVLTNSPTVLMNKYYQLKFTISNRTQGTIASYLNGLPGAPAGVSENKEYIQYFSPTIDGQLQFFTSLTFDGCLSNIQLYELRQDYVFELYDQDGNFILNLDIYASYFEDFVTLRFTFDELDIPYGCYQIYSYDFCNVQFEEIVRDGEFNTVAGNFPGSVWYDNTAPASAGSSTQILNGQLVFTDNNSPIANGQHRIHNCTNVFPDCPDTNPSIPSGAHNYRIEFDVIQNDDDTSHDVQIWLVNTPTTSMDSSVGHKTYILNNIDPDGFVDTGHGLVYVSAQFRNFPVNQVIIIDNLSIRRIEPFTATFKSGCIKYGAEFPCTKIIQAYSDSRAFGFEYDETEFRLQHRLKIRAMNPFYPEDSPDYIYSTGSRSKSFGQSEKFWNLFLERIPEWKHDTVRLQKISTHLLIGDDETDLTEFTTREGDYVPEWDRSGSSDLAPARFDLTLTNADVKFNSKC